MMNAHALGVLEFARVLELIASRAASPAGAARIRALAPGTEHAWIEREQARVAAMRSLAESDLGWTGELIPDVRPALERLRVGGSTLSGADFVRMGVLLRSSRLTLHALRDARRSPVATAMLASETARLVDSRSVESAIERTIADDGTVRDDASPALRRIRKELRGSEGRLISLLEAAVSALEPHQRVADMSVTVRNGRYVIPVRRDARGVVGGIVHDTSATGATLFVEPPAAVEAGNRIRELQADELREVDRILHELTELLRPKQLEFSASLDALVELDSLYARARFAVECGCNPVELANPTQGFAIVEGKHPLLVAQGVAVVPFDLEMLPHERTLLISGPNTGGKTVLLKTVGLCSAMLQSGLPVPVGVGSRIAVFDDVYADVGDEQSIAASLSTFSAHLRNLSEILASATPHSLILIDELGSGTDPVEGAALGGAALEALTTRGSLTVATTHLGALKELAIEVAGVVNASLQFDPVALAPTYRLTKGIPGRSYGISIARRLALPEDVLARAEQRLPTGERDANALLADLEAREKELAEREREAFVIGEEVRERSRRVAERERNARQRERDSERSARAEVRSYLLEARAQVEQAVRIAQSGSASELAAAAREARRRVEAMVAEQKSAIERLDATRGSREGGGNGAARGEPLVVGAYVAVGTLSGRVGQVAELRDDDALVTVGAMKLAVPVATLQRVPAPAAATEPLPLRGSIPEEFARSEIDLRGMRAGEIEDVVMQAVDSAVRADLRTLRIIHGKGTGALRERVTEMLRKESRVESFRPGAWNEGGAGVTMVDLT